MVVIVDGLETEAAIESRLVLAPGGRDKDGRPILLVSLPADLPTATSSNGNATATASSPSAPDRLSHQQPLLIKALDYVLSIFNGDTRNSGLTILIDAQTKSWRQARAWVRLLHDSLKDENATTLVIRPEAFWDKRVDHCTRIYKNSEPMYIPLSRLHKYVESSQLPEELGGSLPYDHNKWTQGRLRVERFFKMNEEVQTELERICKILAGAKEGINNAARTMTQTSATYNNTCQLANLLLNDGRDLLDTYGVECIADNIGQDVLDTRSIVEKQLNLAQSRLASLHRAWAALNKSIADAKEVSRLETAVRSVTNWILETGEVLLAAHNKVGYDITSADQLRREHENVELQCRETYGQYAETLHQIEESISMGVTLPDDLKAQRDFMDFICRSFATRLERRRNVLITSARFFRLVSEYFQATSEVYEKLVMNPDLEKLEAAQATLKQLQESQTQIEDLETNVVREGEKLSDLLSMPVKDALGREVSVDFEADIINIRDILDMTKARSELFTDSMELQRITMQQASHVYHYEKDAVQAIDWLSDLYNVMLKSHCHVGCTVAEIQRQKEEHQLFQDTAKGTFEYGCQLLNAAMSLRQHSKLGEGDNGELSLKLSQSWERFSSLAHSQMTRLRVTAVLHRTLNQQCKELKELITATQNVKGGGQLRRLLRIREKLLIEVARMLRLARLLKTRLKEPLTKHREEERSVDNRNAIEAITERVAEVTALAEQLDLVLCSLHQSELLGGGEPFMINREDSSPSPERITPPPPPTAYSLLTSPCSSGTGGTASIVNSMSYTPPTSVLSPASTIGSHSQQQEWFGITNGSRHCSPGRSHDESSGTAGGGGGSRSEEEFHTASECTCTPPSRSSSFYTTASEGDSPPWWPDRSPSPGAAMSQSATAPSAAPTPLSVTSACHSTPISSAGTLQQSPQILVEGTIKHEIKERQTLRLSSSGCSLTKERTDADFDEETGRRNVVHNIQRTFTGPTPPSQPQQQWNANSGRSTTPEPWSTTGEFNIDVVDSDWNTTGSGLTVLWGGSGSDSDTLPPPIPPVPANLTVLDAWSTSSSTDGPVMSSTEAASSAHQSSQASISQASSAYYQDIAKHALTGMF